MTPKAEAVGAIEQALKMLASPEPLVGLRLNLLKETLNYGLEAVEKIQEVKRKRKEKKS